LEELENGGRTGRRWKNRKMVEELEETGELGEF
jgi:hypothetical protein